MKKTNVNKKSVKKDSIKAPPVPSIYDCHPMIKWLELQVHNCLTGSENRRQKGHPKKVKISESELKKRISTVQDWNLLRRHISGIINNFFHIDMKILLWDLLDKIEMLKSITLDYDNISYSVIGIAHNRILRQIIELLTFAGCTAENIVSTIVRIEGVRPLSKQEVESYQYFFVNLDNDGSDLFPFQSFAELLFQLERSLSHENKIAYQKQNNNSLAKGSQFFVHAPYLDSNLSENYIPLKDSCFGRNIIPLLSYRPVIDLCLGDSGYNDLLDSFGVSEITSESIDQILWSMLTRASAIVRQHFKNGDDAAAIEMFRGIVHPLLADINMLGISIEGEKDNQGEKEEVSMYTQSKFEDTKTINPHKMPSDPKRPKNNKKTKT